MSCNENIKMATRPNNDEPNEERTVWSRRVTTKLLGAKQPIMLLLTISGGVLFVVGLMEDNKVQEVVGGSVGGACLAGGVGQTVYDSFVSVVATCVQKCCGEEEVAEQVISEVVDDEDLQNEMEEAAEHAVQELALENGEVVGGDTFFSTRNLETV